MQKCYFAKKELQFYFMKQQNIMSCFPPSSLQDNSTETFWESGDEDRNKTKWMTVSLLPHHRESGTLPRSYRSHRKNILKLILFKFQKAKRLISKVSVYI